MSDGVPKRFDIGLKITLATGMNLAGQSGVFIRFKKPSGTEGQFTATIEDSAVGTISYTTTSTSDIDEAGEWIFASHVTFTGGNDLEGNCINQNVKDRL